MYETQNTRFIAAQTFAEHSALSFQHSNVVSLVAYRPCYGDVCELSTAAYNTYGIK